MIQCVGLWFDHGVPHTEPKVWKQISGGAKASGIDGVRVDSARHVPSTKAFMWLLKSWWRDFVWHSHHAPGHFRVSKPRHKAMRVFNPVTWQLNFKRSVYAAVSCEFKRTSGFRVKPSNEMSYGVTHPDLPANSVASVYFRCYKD